jgi:hypothetical protein
LFPFRERSSCQASNAFAADAILSKLGSSKLHLVGRRAAFMSANFVPEVRLISMQESNAGAVQPIGVVAVEGLKSACPRRSALYDHSTGLTGDWSQSPHRRDEYYFDSSADNRQREAIASFLGADPRRVSMRVELYPRIKVPGQAQSFFATRKSTGAPRDVIQGSFFLLPPSGEDSSFFQVAARDCSHAASALSQCDYFSLNAIIKVCVGSIDSRRVNCLTLLLVDPLDSDLNVYTKQSSQTFHNSTHRVCLPRLCFDQRSRSLGARLMYPSCLEHALHFLPMPDGDQDYGSWCHLPLDRRWFVPIIPVQEIERGMCHRCDLHLFSK